MPASKVTRILDALAAEEITLDEACATLPGALVRSKRVRTGTLEDLYGDGEPFESGTWDDVSTYLTLGKITLDEYAVLLAATRKG